MNNSQPPSLPENLISCLETIFKKAPSFHYFKQRQFHYLPFVSRLDLIIEKNYPDETFDIPMLSKKLCLCPMQLNRKVKEQTAFSPGKYLLFYRLNKAIDLLLSTEYAIGEIAAHTGFNNQNNFSRAFKRELGMNPCKLRKAAYILPLSERKTSNSNA